MPSVTLLIPGLLPVPEGTELPAGSRLRTVLARADQHELPGDYLSLLACQFRLTLSEEGDWPAAAFSYLGDTGRVPATVCMRIDPVHLATGRDGLVLLDSGQFGITREEAAELVDAIRPLLDEHDASIDMPCPSRWYLQLPAAPVLRTTPLFNIAGREIGTGLPRGVDQRIWHRLFNEIQMTLHDHPVNRAREARGVPTVNSVWFWGIGRLPATVHQHAGTVFANEPVARGIAHACGLTLHPLPDGASELIQESQAEQDCIFIIDGGWCFSQYHDAGGWLDFLESLERDWIAPLLQALERGRIQSLSILVPGHQGYHLKRWHLWRFWRRHARLLV